MMHTRDTRRMFLKMEQCRSLVKLSVTPVQCNCCMGCLLRWWIYQMRCSLDYLRIVYPWKAWMGSPQFDGCIQAMNVLSSERHGFIGAHSTAPFVSTPSILWHLFDPTLVIEECFWGGYFIMCWYTLIVTLTYSEKGLCYCIYNFIVRSLLL